MAQVEPIIRIGRRHRSGVPCSWLNSIVIVSTNVIRCECLHSTAHVQAKRSILSCSALQRTSRICRIIRSNTVHCRCSPYAKMINTHHHYCTLPCLPVFLVSPPIVTTTTTSTKEAVSSLRQPLHVDCPIASLFHVIITNANGYNEK